MKYRMFAAVAALVAFPGIAQAQQQASVSAFSSYVGVWQTTVSWSGDSIPATWNITADGKCAHEVGSGHYVPAVDCKVGPDGAITYKTVSSRGQTMQVRLWQAGGRIQGTAEAGGHSMTLTPFRKR